MTRISLLTAGLIACAAAAPGAFAQATGVYAGGGYSHFDGEDASVGGITGRLGVGFGDFLAIEGEASFGIVDDDVTLPGSPPTNVTVELDNAFGVYGVGRFPVNPQFDLFGRVGWARAEVSGRAGGLGASADEDGLAYGAGGDFWLTARDGLRGEVTRFDFDDGELDVWSASYIRRF